MLSGVLFQYSGGCFLFSWSINDLKRIKFLFKSFLVLTTFLTFWFLQNVVSHNCQFQLIEEQGEFNVSIFRTLLHLSFHLIALETTNTIFVPFWWNLCCFQRALKDLFWIWIAWKCNYWRDKESWRGWESVMPVMDWNWAKFIHSKKKIQKRLCLF